MWQHILNYMSELATTWKESVDVQTTQSLSLSHSGVHLPGTHTTGSCLGVPAGCWGDWCLWISIEGPREEQRVLTWMSDRKRSHSSTPSVLCAVIPWLLVPADTKLTCMYTFVWVVYV